MRPPLKYFWKIALLLGASLVAAYMSVLYIRPYEGVIGNLCEVTAENPYGHCYDMLPSGGFPFTFLWDNGVVSVVGSLSLIEDKFEHTPFLMNWAIYFVGFAIVIAVFRKVR